MPACRNWSWHDIIRRTSAVSSDGVGSYGVCSSWLRRWPAGLFSKAAAIASTATYL